MKHLGLNQKGFTLLELAIAASVMVLLSYFGYQMLTSANIEKLVIERKLNVSSFSARFKTLISRSTSAMALNRFTSVGTFTDQSSVVLQGSIGSFATIAPFNPLNSVLWKRDTFGTDKGPETFAIALNSSSLELTDIDAEGNAVKGGARGYLVSRCVPKEELSQQPPRSYLAIPPGLSHAARAYYVMAFLDLAPRVVFVPKGQTPPPFGLMCCKANQVGADHGCKPLLGPSGVSPSIDYVVKTFLITMDPKSDPSLASSVRSVSEYPSAGEAQDVWGAGFMLTLNTATDASQFVARLFHLENYCRTSSLMNAIRGKRGCMEPNQNLANLKLPGKSASFKRTELLQDYRADFSSFRGNLQKDWASGAGVNMGVTFGSSKEKK